MFRSILLLLSAALSAGAIQVQVTAYSNCGGAKSSETVFTQAFGFSFGCHENEFSALNNLPGIITMESVAVPTPFDPNGPTGDVEARLGVRASLVITAEIPGITPTAWAPCVIATKLGTGSGTVSGAFAGYAAGAPCDFAHASPLIAGSSAAFLDDLTLDAQGNMVLDVRIEPHFFDSAGNDIFASGFGFTATPEPPTAVAFALALAAVLLHTGIAAMRRFV